MPCQFPNYRPLLFFFLFVLMVLVTGAAHAATYYVDNQNPAATDTGPGSATVPYRTVSAAVVQHAGSGNTIQVAPGVYRELVSIVSGGASGAPFVLQAAATGVVIEGADALGAGAWSAVGGGVYLAASVTWAPGQVFVDGQRLALSTVTPVSAIPAHSFEYVPAAGLYVNLGGDAPSAHVILAGHRRYGFQVTAASWVTIQGFTILHSDEKGVYLNGASQVQVLGNRIELARINGVHAFGGSDLLVAGNAVANGGDHGIYFTNGVTRSVIRGNESFGNARPLARAANGIQLFGSSGNRVENNRLHDNQDTGLQMSGGANDNLSTQNQSWNNGDHGYDHLASTGTVHIGDVAYGNFRDGFSFEGSSPNSGMYDCIAAQNGVTTSAPDLLVDSTSAIGFVSDYDLVWNSVVTRPIRFAGTFYGTVTAFHTATGNETHGIQADPRFVAPQNGDFHLLAGSPAIDAATSAPAGWPSLDAAGMTRADDPATPNHGAGPVPYADLGAYEFTSGVGANQPPIASLTAQPTLGTEPLPVVLDASGSHDPDGRILSYQFDFGDGTHGAPSPLPTAAHVYGAGVWTARVTVTDNQGATASDTATITVRPRADHPPIVWAPTVFSATADQTVSIRVLAYDPDGEPIQSLTADLSGLPLGNDATFVTDPNHAIGELTWHPTSGDTGTFVVRFVAANTLADTATTHIEIAPAQGRAPVVQAPPSLHAVAGQLVAFTVTAMDPDGDPIASLTMQGDALPGGASFTVNGDHTQGTFRWQVPAGTRENFHLRFVAQNALTGTKVSNLHIRASLREPEPADGPGDLPVALALSEARPNPSRGSATLALDLPRAAQVEWRVFDLAGRAVYRAGSEFGAGTVLLAWDGRGDRGERLSSGVYLMRVNVEGLEFVRRIVRE